MKAYYFILFLSFGLLSFPGISDAQQPFLIDVASVISGTDSSVVVQVSRTDSLNITVASQEVLNRLSSEGYFSSTIDSVVAVSEFSTQFFIHKGPRSTLSKIIDDYQQEYCEFLWDTYFSSSSLENCLKSVIASLNNSGFPFSTASISEINTISDVEVSVQLSVQKNDFVSISTYQFDGNNTLNNKVLAHIVGYKVPVAFTPEFIEESLSRLNRSEFISTSSYSGLSRTNSLYSAVFSIQEVRSSTVDLLLGLEPKNDAGYRLVGQGNLKLNHLFVPASSLNLEFNRSGTTESGLSLIYDQYHISSLPLGYGFGIEMRQVDSTYLSLASRISTHWRLDSRKSLGSNFNFNSVSNSESQLREYQLSQDRYDFGLTFDFNSINNWRVPTSGSSFKASVSTGYAYIDDNRLESDQQGGYALNNFEINYTRYLPLLQRFILVPSMQFMHSIQEIYYDIDRIRFGGTKSMRGFREDQFRLAGFFMTSVEGRWMLSKSSYLYSFASAAYTWTPDELGSRSYNLDYNTLYSGGFGISYRVRPGILNVSYAVSNDDSWLNGKIHFGITNSL